MQINVLRNLGAGWPSYAEGQTVDCPNGIAEQLISKKLAEAVVIEAVAKEPELKAVARVDDSVSLPADQTTVSDAPAVKSKTSSKEK